MYIVTRTADEIPVLGPMSYLLILIQHIRCKIVPTATSSTHRYAGATAQSRLKNRITRHESRRPSPKVTGPNDPDANLGKRQTVGSDLREPIRGKTHARQYVHIRRQPYEEYFDKMRLCSVFDVNGMDTYRVWGCASRVRGIPAEHSLISVDQYSMWTNGTHPASPLPSSKVFPK